MSQKFQAAVQHRNDVSYVKLGGVIDEDNELGELVDKIPTGTAVIDLGEIERINSCGVRDWVNWLSKLEGNGTRSVLVECSPAIVAQINLVNNFTGSGVVKSFYVPYFCPECNEEKVLLVEAGDMGPAPHEPPTCRCDECDLVMEFDDMADSYFAFLSNQRKLADSHSDKLTGAMRDLGRQSSSMDRKVRTRASQPNLAPPAGAPMPSLPMAQRSAPQMPYVVPQPAPLVQHHAQHQMQHSGSAPNGMQMQASHPSGAMQMPQHGSSPPGPAPHYPSGSVPYPTSGPASGPHAQSGGVPQGSVGVPRVTRPSAFVPNPSGPMVGPPGPRLTGNLAHYPQHGNAGGFAFESQQTHPVGAQARSNALVVVLVLILLGAVGVLAYLVLSK